MTVFYKECRSCDPHLGKTFFRRNISLNLRFMFHHFFRKNNSKQRTFTNIIIAGILIFGLGWFIIYGSFLFSWDFRNNLWAPSFLLLRGHSPYDVHLLYENSNAVWMPMAIGLLFPLGFLPLQQATNLWLIVNCLGLIIIIWISSGVKKPPIYLFFLSLLAVFLFPPVISHLVLGQTSIGLTLIMLASTRKKFNSPILIALLIALALIKPQLTILFLPGFFISFYKIHGSKKTISLTLLVLTWGIFLCLPLFFADSKWYQDFLLAFQNNPSWEHPSSLVVLMKLIPQYGMILWAGLALGIFGLNLWIWQVQPQSVAILWSLALTPLISPYIWSWDFVVMLPLVIFTFFQIRSKAAYWFLSLGYVLCWVIIMKLNFSGQISNYYFWWVPWALIGIISSTFLLDIPRFKISSKMGS